LNPSIDDTPIVGGLRSGALVALVVVKDGWGKIHPMHYRDLEHSNAHFSTSEFQSHDPLIQGWCVTTWHGEDQFDIIPPSSPAAQELQAKAEQWHAAASTDSKLALAMLQGKPETKPTTVHCKNGHECLPFTYTKQHNCDLRGDPLFEPHCLKRFRVGDKGYRCSSCDYDVCMACYGLCVPPLETGVESSSDLLTLLVSLVAALKNQPAASVPASPPSFPRVFLDTHSLFHSVASAIASGSPRSLDAVKASCSLITAVFPGSSMLSRLALAFLDTALHPDLLPADGTCRITVPDWTIKAALPQQSAVMPLMFAGSPLICMPAVGWADISPFPSATFTFRVSIPAACVLAFMRVLSSSTPPSSPQSSAIEILADSSGLPQDVVATAVDELKTLGVLKAGFAAAASSAGGKVGVALADAWCFGGASDDLLSSGTSPYAHFQSPCTPDSRNRQMRDDAVSSTATPSTGRTAIGFFSSSPYAPPSHPALASSSSIIRSHNTLSSSNARLYRNHFLSSAPHTLACATGLRRNSIETSPIP
jgi:hypothetical protein